MYLLFLAYFVIFRQFLLFTYSLTVIFSTVLEMYITSGVLKSITAIFLNFQCNFILIFVDTRKASQMIKALEVMYHLYTNFQGM